MTVSSWKKYNDSMNLYKYYFDLSLRIIMWYSGVVGAIFAFFVAYQSLMYITYILIIPIFLSILLSALSSSSINMLKIIGVELSNLAKELKLNSYPTTLPLIWIMQSCCVIFMAIAAGLTIIFFLNL